MGGVHSSTSPLIDLGGLARRLGVAAAIIAVAAAGVAAVTVDVATTGLSGMAMTWLGLALVALGPTALALTAGSAVAGLRRARRRGEPLSDRPGVAPPQLRR